MILFGNTYQASNVAQPERAAGGVDEGIEGVRVRRQLPRLHGLQHSQVLSLVFQEQ